MQILRKGVQVVPVVSSALLLLVVIMMPSSSLLTTSAFHHPTKLHFTKPTTTITTTTTTTTSLYAIGALAKKAKQADLRKYVENGIEDSVMEKYNIIQKAKKEEEEKQEEEQKTTTTPTTTVVGPLQESLTRRKGTITVIAEYKRKQDQAESGFIGEMYEPEILSPVFREYGASAIAVMADERMGGCTYDDLKCFIEEQRRAKHLVPGPIHVINSDMIIDELQIARTAAYGANACFITYSIVTDDLFELLNAAKAVGIEAIVSVSTFKEAQKSIELGAKIIHVNVDGADEKSKIIDEMNNAAKNAASNGTDDDDDDPAVCVIANIMAKDNKQLSEVEEVWAVRDKGFQGVWVCDALYKSGADETEHPGAIIKSMKSKSSLKWASPKAYSGRGEGAREYLGDILM